MFLIGSFYGRFFRVPARTFDRRPSAVAITPPGSFFSIVAADVV